MAMGYLHCQMEPGMKESGRMALSMVREHSRCQMEPGMQESGEMASRMESEQIDVDIRLKGAPRTKGTEDKKSAEYK